MSDLAVLMQSLLLPMLADGRFHSGSALASRLGISRAAVWKQVEQLRGWGVPVEAVTGRGYRLSSAVELLDPEVISASVSRQRQDPPAVEVQLVCSSTSSLLLERARANAPAQVLLAELQNAGRGRWGRQWQSHFGGGLYMSLLWRFSLVPAGLAGLSLASAVAVVDVLRRAGAEQVGLKWPNDIVSAQGKLGGILVELIGEPTGPCSVVIGVGLNVKVDEAQRREIDQPLADLHQFVGSAALARNQLAADLIVALAGVCESFPRHGLAPYRDRWTQYDSLRGRPVVLHLPGGQVEGTAAGIDERGALCLKTAEGTLTYFSGDVQLKLRPNAAR